MSELSKEEMRDRLGNIDQIRDIIIGSQLREFNARFGKIETDISLLEQEMRDRVEEIKTTLLGEIKFAIEALDKKLKSAITTTQQEQIDLRQQIDRNNKKFSTSIESLDKDIDTQTDSIRSQMNQSIGKLQEDVHNLRTQIFEQLDLRFATLSGVKVSRDDMAELLFELGMRLKGTEFVPKLKQAAEDSVDTDVRLIEPKFSDPDAR
jgi:ferritin-like metal-binding protein YciE